MQPSRLTTNWRGNWQNFWWRMSTLSNIAVWPQQEFSHSNTCYSDVISKHTSMKSLVLIWLQHMLYSFFIMCCSHFIRCCGFFFMCCNVVLMWCGFVMLWCNNFIMWCCFIMMFWGCLVIFCALVMMLCGYVVMWSGIFFMWFYHYVMWFLSKFAIVKIRSVRQCP